MMLEVKTALLSVYDKQGIVEFAKGLERLGIRVLGSRGTVAELSQAGLMAQDVADFVGGDPILGHKVVTLSRELHAGLLADYVEDREEMEELGLEYIDLVCVDLYPLGDLFNQSTHQRTLEAIREKTDIGGPTMLRAAAKGGRIVVCDPHDRETVLRLLERWHHGDERACRLAPYYRLWLAAKAEHTVRQYCQLSEDLLTDALGRMQPELFGEELPIRFGPMQL